MQTMFHTFQVKYWLQLVSPLNLKFISNLISIITHASPRFTLSFHGSSKRVSHMCNRIATLLAQGRVAGRSSSLKTLQSELHSQHRVAKEH